MTGTNSMMRRSRKWRERNFSWALKKTLVTTHFDFSLNEVNFFVATCVYSPENISIKKIKI